MGYSPIFVHCVEPYFAKRSTLASTKREFLSISTRDSVPVYPSWELIVSDPVEARGARPSEPAAVRKPLPHSSFPVTRPHLDPLERVFTGNLTGEKCRQVAPAYADDDRGRVAVGRRQPRSIVVAPGGNGEPFSRTDAERAAMVEHRVHQRLLDFAAKRF